MKSDRIVIEPGNDYKELFLRLAKKNGVSQKEMFRTMVDDHFGNYVVCPSCNEVLFDRRTMSVSGPGVIVCQKCKHQFNENFD